MPAAIAIPLITSAASAGATIYGASRASGAAKRSAQYGMQQANYAANLEAQAADKALAFAKEQEAARQQEFKATQDRNYQLWQADQAREQGRYDDLQSRMQPYRRLGAGAVGQMMHLPVSLPGTLGARMGG